MLGQNTDSLGLCRVQKSPEGRLRDAAGNGLGDRAKDTGLKACFINHQLFELMEGI